MMRPQRLFAKRAAAVVGVGFGAAADRIAVRRVAAVRARDRAVLIGVAAPAWVWCSASGARAQRLLAAERVVEEQPLSATIEVRRSALGLPGAEVIDPSPVRGSSSSGPLSPFTWRPGCQRQGRDPVPEARAADGWRHRRWWSAIRWTWRGSSGPASAGRSSCWCSRGPSACGGCELEPRPAFRAARRPVPAEAFAAVDVDGLRRTGPGPLPAGSTGPRSPAARG